MFATLGFGRMPLGESCRVAHWRHRGQGQRPQTPTLPWVRGMGHVHHTIYGVEISNTGITLLTALLHFRGGCVRCVLSLCVTEHR